MEQSRNKRNYFQIEQLEDRWTPSGGVTPAAGKEFGLSNGDLVKQGFNIGQDFCSIEKGDCAADVHELVNPPGLR